MSSDSHQHDWKFLFGFFIGGFLGALTLFFLGTKEGKRVRNLLEDKGEDLVGGLQSRIADLEVRGKELVEKGESLKEELITQIEEKGETLTQEASERIDTTLAHIEALQEHGRETTSNLRSRLFKNLPKRNEG